MIKAILSDFSRTLLFPKDENYRGSLNDLYKSVKETAGFAFFDFFTWNQELAEYFVQLKEEQNIALYIFTTDKIQDDPEVTPYLYPNFSKVFRVADIGGFKKDNPEAYKSISALLNLKPEEILFIDDAEANLGAARTAGMKTLQYRGVEKLKSKAITIFA